MPGPVIAGHFGGKLDWTAHYKKLEGSKHSAGAQSSNGRVVRWYRHEDDPAWGEEWATKEPQGDFQLQNNLFLFAASTDENPPKGAAFYRVEVSVP